MIVESSFMYNCIVLKLHKLTFMDNIFESLSVCLRTANQKYNLIFIYKHLDTSIVSFIEYLKSKIFCSVATNIRYILISDFNVNLMNPCIFIHLMI